MERHDDLWKKTAPLLAALAVYAVAWCDLFLPQPPLALFGASWFALSAAKGVLRCGFILLVMARWHGLGDFGLGAKSPLPRAADLANALLVAASAAAAALILALFAALAGAGNPLFASAGAAPGWKAAALMAASSLATGYSEELYFRYFAVAGLRRSGFGPRAAALVSALLFGVSHASQGAYGIVAASLLALVFSFHAAKGRGIHALALGHALYDFALLAAILR
ncbi:CPBP family intramembrane metalloprotease [bacterium]|nr:CPBP family intramembrane metalloprotease [bacterium]